MIDTTDTITALATAIGTGSIAVIRVSGKASIQITNKIFVGKDLSQQPGNTIHFGKIKHKNTDIDQVIISIFREPHSYTGENVVEISSHSNHFIVEDIIEALLENGARIAEPGEFTQRAFINHKIDLMQAEGVSNIISSKSRLATRNSLLQIEGTLSSKILELRNEIIDLISFLELDLDFSEEENDIISREELVSRMEQLINNITDLISGNNKAKHLSGAVEIAIIGKPNAGKSKILNTLLGENRAIVTNIPGTTRDTIEENITLKNMLLKLSDTAGIRFSKNQIEQEGIERTWNRVERADLVLWVIDLSQRINKNDKNILEILRKKYIKDTIIVGNKIDKKILKETDEKIKTFKLNQINISAKTGEGINRLKDEIYKIISLKFRELGEEVIITNSRQIELLKNALKSLILANKSIETGSGNEFIVIELKDALNKIGQITGETTTEDILNNIFSGFCIGK